MRHGLFTDGKVVIFLAGLLTRGSPSDRAFPGISRIREVSPVAPCGPRPRSQRWPNVTDSHRIPFSPPPSRRKAGDTRRDQ